MHLRDLSLLQKGNTFTYSAQHRRTRATNIKFMFSQVLRKLTKHTLNTPVYKRQDLSDHCSKNNCSRQHKIYNSKQLTLSSINVCPHILYDSIQLYLI